MKRTPSQPARQPTGVPRAIDSRRLARAQGGGDPGGIANLTWPFGPSSPVQHDEPLAS